ncbi:hypothetical protein GF360_03320 [candidate division WWE3 bacterium]|nr:hypothetical protein [candidate division WWE3 bacterium]
MKANLAKKDKILLLLGAGLMILAWVAPVGIKAIKSRKKSPEKTEAQAKIDKDSPVWTVQEYLQDLLQAPQEEVEEILGISNSLVMDYAIDRVSYNEQVAKVETKIYVFNSFLEGVFYLEQVEEMGEGGQPEGGTPEKTQEWQITNIEFGNTLNYKHADVLLQHDFEWQITPQQIEGEFLAAWKAYSTKDELEIMFLVEGSSGMYSKRLMDCSLEQVSNCGVEEWGDREVKAAVLTQQMLKILLFESGKEDASENEGGTLEKSVNVLVLIPNVPEYQNKKQAVDELLTGLQL